MRISGTGSWVIDVLCEALPIETAGGRAKYFYSESNRRGIVRGAATLKSDLEKQFGLSIDRILGEILAPGEPPRTLGGVGAATLIGASQMLEGSGVDVFFYTNVGEDENGRLALEQLGRTPVRLDKIEHRKAPCPTCVIVNEAGDGGAGQERSFLCEPNAGSGLVLDPSRLDEDFFSSEITFFAGLFWEPRIKADLSRILAVCKGRGCVTVVGAASDPNLLGVTGRWELGDGELMYRFLDVLIMDRAEALAYSGQNDLAGAVRYFKGAGVGSLLVTDGQEPTFFSSDGRVFREAEGFLPVARPIILDKLAGKLPTGDTVGCGDNFASGVLASLATQLRSGGEPSIEEAAFSGNLCGAFASTYSGGTYYEGRAGEKRERIEAYIEPYRRYISEARR